MGEENKKEKLLKSLLKEHRFPERYQEFFQRFMSEHHFRELKKKFIIINNFIVISLLYYLILTPISFILKLFGKSFLKLRFSRQNSYWESKKIIDYERKY